MFIRDAEAAVVGFHLVGHFFDQMRAAEMAQAANTLEALGVEPGITRLTIFRQAEMASRNESELAC